MIKILLENNQVTIELENGIVIATWKSAFVDLNIAQQAVEYRIDSTNHITYPVLANITPVKNSTKEARDFLASEKGCEGIKILAILVNSPITSMIGNFFFRISKPLVPTKIFTDEIEAKKWLKQYIK